MDTNGIPKQPAILLFWDEASQSVQVQTNPAQIKNLAFAKALLDQAAEAVGQQVRFQSAAMMQRMAEEQAENQALARKVLRSN